MCWPLRPGPGRPVSDPDAGPGPVLPESDFGKAALERERKATSALEAENKRIEAELVAEEQSLTELRKTLSAAEFSAKADAFDAKVERIRSEQDAKAQVLTQDRDKDRKEFLQVAVPVLGALLARSRRLPSSTRTRSSWPCRQSTSRTRRSPR